MRNSSNPPNERERLRQEERKNSAGGSLNDGYQRADNGNFSDLTSRLGWKGTGLLIVAFVALFIVVSLIMD